MNFSIKTINQIFISHSPRLHFVLDKRGMAVKLAKPNVPTDDSRVAHLVPEYVPQQGKKIMFKENWLTNLQKIFPFWVQNIVIIKDETIVNINAKYLIQLIYFLKLHTNGQYKIVTDVTAIDYPESTKRFEVVYILLSPFFNNRIRIKTIVDEMTPLPSLTKIYPGINWMERETWDMFGIYFYDHPDLRRILTDYGFDGFPLLKNFPLSGFLEVRYDDEQKRVVNEPIEITQEFRNFDMISPWVSRSSIND